MNRLTAMYVEVFGKFPQLQSPFLLAVRLYWSWQFVQTGWGNMHKFAKNTEFITTLNIPSSAVHAYLISGLEFLQRVLPILAMSTRLVGLPLAANQSVAYWSADLERFVYVFF